MGAPTGKPVTRLDDTNHLAVDVHTDVWRIVREHIERRMDTLAAVALAPSTPDDKRREVVHRRDELQRFLQAPAETVRRASMRADGTSQTY